MSQLQLAAQQVDEALDRLESVLQQRTALGLDVHLQQELATLQADNEALRETAANALTRLDSAIDRLRKVLGD